MKTKHFQWEHMSDEIYKKQVGGNHYKSMVIQPSEFINRNNIPFAEGNAIKYLCRHKQKNQKEDLLKAKHYIDMAIDRDYPAEVKEEIKEKNNSWGIVK
jgi:hypothetical protein